MKVYKLFFTAVYDVHVKEQASLPYLPARAPESTQTLTMSSYSASFSVMTPIKCLLIYFICNQITWALEDL